MRIILLILLVWSCVFQDTQGTDRLGFPRIVNYTKDDYKAATMNWTIVKGERGKVYCGNDYGLLVFDGVNWECVLQPTNRTYVQSLSIDHDNTIYIGAYDEFGYAVRNPLGQMNYQSLNHLLPEEHRKYGIVWDIIPADDKVYFFTDQKIFVYHQNKISTISVGGQIRFAQKLKRNIYVKLEGQPLMVLKDTLSMAENALPTAPLDLKSLLHLNGRLVLVTSNDGLFELWEGGLRVWDTPVNEVIKKHSVNICKQLSNNKLAFGTLKDGLFICDDLGTGLLNITKDTGLQNNAIQHIYEDEIGNLWLALSKGISCVELGSEFYYMNSENGLDGSVYSTAVFDNSLYLATNQGVYTLGLEARSADVKFIRKTEAHAWNLSVIDNDLLLANHNGAFQIKNGEIIPVNFNDHGAWQFVKHPDHEEYLFQGSYKGIMIYQRSNDQWRLKGHLKGFDETAREMVFDDESNLWVGHGYQGIYKLQLSENLDSVQNAQLFNTGNGLPYDHWNNLFKLGGEILIGTQRGVYGYNRDNGTMIPKSPYYDLLGDKMVRRLVEMPNGDIFFITGLDNADEMGIIHSNDGYKIRKTPFQKLKGELIPAFESISFFGDQVLIGAKNGLIIYDQNVTRPVVPFSTNINTVSVINIMDSVIYGHREEFDLSDFPDDFVQEIPFDLNNLKMSYSSTYFEGTSDLLYRSYLKGFDDDWSVWTNATSREFTNLAEGEYTFLVESKNAYGMVGSADQFVFTVLPPWYRTSEMYLLYFMGMSAGVLLFWRIRSGKYDPVVQGKGKTEKEQRYEHANVKVGREIIDLEEQIELLRDKLEHKNKELASSTLNLAQQNEVVTKVIKRFETIGLQHEKVSSKELSGLLSPLKDVISEEAGWNQFEVHFNEVHDDFIKRLKSRYPGLTARDIRLCTYLRMNLSSKEIASLLGISYRGVEALRYRIRKKLDLSGNNNLTSFILDF